MLTYALHVFFKNGEVTSTEYATLADAEAVAAALDHYLVAEIYDPNDELVLTVDAP